jgi:hypothetical protein
MRDADLTPTGRELKDPAATLVECVDSEGLKHTVIAFDEAYRGHTALTTGVDLIMSFMAYPMVTGLVECTAADTRRARFAYPTGTMWTVKEVARGYDQVGQTVGVRAALELCYLAGMVLHEAGETGPIQGCFSHGNLNPWRIGMKVDGQLQVFGYGLAQVEMDHFLREVDPHIGIDSIRYAPPERLERQPEQPSSDVHSLAVIALELMTGQSLYDEADPETVWNAVKLAEGVQRIGSLDVPQGVKDVLGAALVYDPDRRLAGQSFVDAVGNLLDDPAIPGRTLAEVMARMGNQGGGQSKRKLVKTTETAAFTPADLAALTADDEPVESPEKSARWTSLKGGSTTGRRGVRRAATRPASGSPRRTRDEAVADAPAASPPPEPPRRRRRRGTEEDEEKAAAVVAPSTPDDPGSETADPAPRRRRRRRTTTDETSSAGADADAPTPDSVSSDTDASDTSDASDSDASDASDTDVVPRRRRRRSASTESTESTTDTTEKAEEASEEPSPRRRRRRSPDSPPPADDLPAPRKRRRRRTSSSSDEDDETSNDESSNDADDADDADTAAAPAPRRRRRRRKTDSSKS